jgi:DNA-directed RNA polymerase subunit E'/Rpb7
MNVATDVVKVPSFMLTKDLRQNILSILRSTKEGTCTKKFGCILSIVELLDIHDSKICIADRTNHFHVTYSFNSFMPEVDVQYNASVFKSYPIGIIATIEGCTSIKILTPPGQYSCGDDIKVRIREIQFADESFMCDGDIL